MSLRRFNRIAIKLLEQFVQQLKNPKIYAIQRILGHEIKKIGIQAAKPVRAQLRRTIFRGFQRVARQRYPLLRPFATLHFHQQRLQELDQSRRRGLLYLRQTDAKRDVLQRVRHIFGTNVRYNQALAFTEMPETLNGYDIGKYIACGCNGAVYELKIHQIEPEGCGINHKTDTLTRYPLALKLMFNYDFYAPERVIWQQMGSELVPLAPLPKALRDGKMANIKTLPRPHPNLIKMHTAFIDRMPVLSDAERLYPEVLPNLQEFEFSIKEPRTLFVVMKRYRMTLHEYVTTRKRNYWVGRVMFGQLLEAIVFLHQNRISHRDMKSDNILLDFNSDEEVPHLVLSDFGSALATGTWLLPYPNEDLDLGGNLALRAPEIRRANPGPQSIIDFEMADTWAAGTLAYEIFTRRNPFYAVLSSENYKETDLPPLPTRLIEPIKKVIEEMLRVDPKGRPMPEIAANVLAISLFRFGKDLSEFFRNFGLQWFWSMEKMRSTFSNVSEKMENKIRDMTELYASETILARFINPTVISSAELQLRATFLSRVDKEELRTTLDYFLDPNGDVFTNGNAFPPNWSYASMNVANEAFSSAEGGMDLLS